jgi:hypothetical protein
MTLVELAFLAFIKELSHSEKIKEFVLSSL